MIQQLLANMILFIIY